MKALPGFCLEDHNFVCALMLLLKGNGKNILRIMSEFIGKKMNMMLEMSPKTNNLGADCAKKKFHIGLQLNIKA